MSRVEQVLAHYGHELDSQGKCCCPLHEENTPSFSYYEESDSWYCWGKCSIGGDAIQLVRELEPDLTFKEVVSKLEEIIGEEVSLNSSEGKKVTELKPSEVPPLPIDVLKEIATTTVYQEVNYRGIRSEVDKYFKHRSVVDESGKVVRQYYPETNSDGAICRMKCRVHPKNFNHNLHVGKSAGKDGQLSGQFLCKGGGKYVLVVGGEIDKASAHQMFMDYQKSRGQEDLKVCDVVSSRNGEGGASKELAAQYEFLDQYETIILGLDNDKAGIKAMEECVKVLPKEKVRIAKWSMNDPNEMLQAGKQKQFIRDFYNAKEIVNSGIKNSFDAFDEVKEYLTAPKIPLPPHLHRVQDAHRGGLRGSGFIGNIIGDTSVGKTFVTDTLLNYWIPLNNIIPIVISIERTAGEFTADLLSIHLKNNLTWFKDGWDAVEYLDRPEVKKLCDDFLADDYGMPRFYVIDERDGSLEVLQNKMQMAASKYNTNFFIIDPLTDILRSMGNDDQDRHMMWQKQKKKDGWKILNVLHTRKPPTDKEGKPRKVTEYDAHGSGTFVQSSDFNWVLNRDKMASDAVERNTMTVDIPKVRGGTTGEAAQLYYDKTTRQHYDKVDYFSGNVDSSSNGYTVEESTPNTPPTEGQESGGNLEPEF